MNLHAVCIACGDVPVNGPAVVVHPRMQPQYWRCSFVCSSCGTPRTNAVAPAAGLFLVARGAAVLPGPRPSDDIDFIGTDDVAEFRQALDAVVSVDELFG